MGIIVKKAKYIVETFKNVASTRKRPRTISVVEPPWVWIKSPTYQKKLFFKTRGNSFHDSQLAGSNAQGMKVYSTLSILKRICKIGIISAKEKRLRMAERMLNTTFSTIYFL